MAIDYVPVDWGPTTYLSGKNLNHLETMAEALESHISEHGHPSVHYLKAESDAKFFPQALGLDANMIDGEDANDLMGNQSPLGFTILHKGADNEFSNGYLIADPRWHISDGGTYNGIHTVDMRGYFPKCPATSSGTGGGGAATLTMTGTANVGNHTLTVAELPVHYHTLLDVYYSGGVGIIIYSAYTGGVHPNQTSTQRTTSLNHAGADEAHNHGTKSISLNAINLTPLWKSYYFIVKVA